MPKGQALSSRLAHEGYIPILGLAPEGYYDLGLGWSSGIEGSLAVSNDVFQNVVTHEDTSRYLSILLHKIG